MAWWIGRGGEVQNDILVLLCSKKDPGVGKAFIKYYNKDYSPEGEERKRAAIDDNSLVNKFTVRSSQRIKYGRRVFLLGVPWTKGAACDQ